MLSCMAIRAAGNTASDCPIPFLSWEMHRVHPCRVTFRGHVSQTKMWLIPISTPSPPHRVTSPMNFISTKRLFSKPLYFTSLPPLLFDVLLIVMIYATLGSIETLKSFSSGLSPLFVSPSTFIYFGGLCVYGIRISMFIAAFRRNRAPQVWEWMTTLIGLGLAIIFCVMAGPMQRGFAHLHGYRSCGEYGARTPDAVFVVAGSTCPPRNNKSRSHVLDSGSG